MLKNHEILRRGAAPLYLQVASVMRKRIESAQWGQDERLPSLEALAEEFQVSRVTARQAVGILEEDGLIWRKQGKGTFVTNRPDDRRWFNLQTEWSNLIKLIEGTSIKFISASDDQTCPELGPDDGIMAPSYHYMRRVSIKDKFPYCVINIYLDQRVFQMAPKDFESELVLSVLDRLEGLKIKRAHQILTISTADMDSAKLLDISLDAPVAIVRRVVTDQDDTIVYVGDVVYRGDFVKLDIELI
ncbi:MAG: GntR family transcriptional regulator [Desulfarculaceae bacterium]|nr:GntR family transcriptional regulator [Desulfarculaceae bacterium]MCF8046763.1 GntR family transcriptional regulator [Desulfarculaceae bacterium]MCF8099881.1 GntR family transcriptional regulator [Desulfarculaceae bacterium]MCF8124541.1 GntR family transcriptional regulator [Desulfarculaceae bacterium]